MRELVSVVYTDFPVVRTPEVPAIHKDLLADEIPGFVVRTRAVSLADALERTGVDVLFNLPGFCSAGDISNPFYFRHARGFDRYIATGQP